MNNEDQLFLLNMSEWKDIKIKVKESIINKLNRNLSFEEEKIILIAINNSLMEYKEIIKNRL